MPSGRASTWSTICWTLWRSMAWPFVQWGCHPELLEIARERRATRSERQVTFLFPGGFLGHRKPLEPVLDAFMATGGSRLRLVVKAQVERKAVRAAERAAKRDPRISLDLGDKPTAAHLRELAAADVCLAPARWEGLGLPLFEAIAFGQPVITNDAPPMNEPIHHEVNGLLVASHRTGSAKSGIPAVDPDRAALTAAIERLADDGERRRLVEGAQRVRDTERRWEDTVRGFGELLERVA